jgi:glycosyltransferase involved in cell wall biosynthesis
MSLTIILPTLNEFGNISPLIQRLLLVLKDLNHFEILVIDDQSTDGTREQIQSLEEVDPRVKLITREQPDGLMGAIRHGILLAETDFICWMDSDGSMPADSLAELWSKKETGADIIIGSRFVPGGGFKGITKESRKILSVYRTLKSSNDSITAMLLSRLLNKFLRIVLGRDVNDYTSGFILMRKELIFLEDLNGYYGEYFPVFLYKSLKRGFKILEVPYINLPRIHGVSKTGTNIFSLIKTGVPYITYAVNVRLKWRYNKFKQSLFDI